ncbi:MAG: hypothetical protein HZB79_08200 [Deltaproteobacteria bacterium]|nr:hypothetical protein [Deltaproteobacteria bacterium]
MKKRYQIFLLSTFLIFLQFECSVAFGGTIWEFNSEEDLRGWSGQNGRFSFIKQDGFVRIEGSKEPAFISPPELNLSMDKTYFLKIRLKSSDAVNSNGFILFRTKGSPTFFSNSFLSFNIKHGGEFHDYMVNFKDFFAPETILEQFAITFTGGNIIEIDSVEIYELSFIESAWHKIKQGFLAEEVIRGVTINTVTTPLVGSITFPVFLYGIALIISIGIILFRRRWTMNDISKAVIISFICIGFIFALRMDYNWFRIWQKDIKMLSGKKVEERIVTLEGADLYNFINLAKTIIPKDKKAKRITERGDDYFAIKGKYYLMPIKTSKDGDYIVAYMDKTVAFDPVTRILSKDGKTIVYPVEMVYNYNNYGFIYRIIK